LAERFVVCCACRCHVRTGELRCPHCDSELAASDATRRPRRRTLEVRRVVVASALVGLATTSCGGRADGEGTGTGTMTASVIPRAPSVCVLADGGPAECDPGSAAPVCQCDAYSYCDTNGAYNTCIQVSWPPPTKCPAGTYLDPTVPNPTIPANCVSVYWFSGDVPQPSDHSCYGAPPPLS
jgi:hypothetical protein